MDRNSRSVGRTARLTRGASVVNRPPSIAKITKPRLAEVVPRERLFRRLDRARARSLVWISGPAGSGKTTLAASYLDDRKLPFLWYHLDESDNDLATFFYYLGQAAANASPRRSKQSLPLLTPEYGHGIAAFTRKYFECLCSRVTSPFVIVLDNYHHLADESPFHGMIREAFHAVPEGITVMINSRGAPPQSLAALAAGNRMERVGWEELKFDLREASSLLRKGREAVPGRKLAAAAHAMTEGWAAGLVLLAEQIGSSKWEPRELDRFRPQEFFDYFASELFEKAGAETQDFLLKTSFLPDMTPDVAAAITGYGGARSLLMRLRKNHFFTEQRSLNDPVYQYHPLFRQFLQIRAEETLTPDAACDLRRRAAELLERSGRIEDAAELYRTVGSWDGLVRVIVANARTLLSQGRYRPVEDWLRTLPPAVLDREPWLLYWMGVCRMPRDLVEGRTFFERALDLFRRRKDAAGVFLSWSGAIESLVQEMGDIKRLDRWVAMVFDLMQEYDFPSQDIENEITARIFTALPWDPANPQFVAWRSRALQLIESAAEPDLRLMTSFYLLAHHIWIGDYTTGRIALEVIRRLAKSRENSSPLAYCMAKMCEGWFVWLTGDAAQSIAILQEALARAEETGIHIWDRNVLELVASASLCRGDLDRAGELVDHMAAGLDGARLFDRFYYHSAVAWCCLMQGDVRQAEAHQERARAMAERTAVPINAAEGHFGMALCARARGSAAKAREYAAEVRRAGRRMGSELVEYEALLLDAALAFDDGKEEPGLRALRAALQSGKDRGFVYFKWWLPSMMTMLFRKALENGIETAHVRDLIMKCRLVPDESALPVEAWPWPVRITTLGGFGLVVDEKPVSFSGKVQKKPLDMLKALIAFGGTSVSEDLIIDALWPDAEGDTARISFKTTLHRLRALLGKEELLLVREGRVSLDKRRCWVDVWAFEKLIERVEPGDAGAGARGKAGRSEPSGRHGEIMRHLEKALALYHGHFLSDDDDKPWSVSMRERLKAAFADVIGRRGRRAEEDRDWNSAIAVYERGLTVDDLSEGLYGRLMTCYLARGRKAEALKVYERCRKTLAAAFGIEPSEEIRDLYEKTAGRR
jgi:LuxR family maltose regulon positive regulatory protein